MIAFVLVLLLSSWYGGWLCHLGTVGGCVVSVRQFGFHCRFVTFICVWETQISKVHMIRDKKSNQWSLICCRIRVKCIIVIIVTSNL